MGDPVLPEPHEVIVGEPDEAGHVHVTCGGAGAYLWHDDGPDVVQYHVNIAAIELRVARLLAERLATPKPTREGDLDAVARGIGWATSADFRWAREALARLRENDY